MQIHEMIEHIQSKEQFLEFLAALKRDSAVGVGWENGSVETFLDAMHAWAYRTAERVFHHSLVGAHSLIFFTPVRFMSDHCPNPSAGGNSRRAFSIGRQMRLRHQCCQRESASGGCASAVR